MGVYPRQPIFFEENKTNSVLKTSGVLSLHLSL